MKEDNIILTGYFLNNDCAGEIVETNFYYPENFSC